MPARPVILANGATLPPIGSEPDLPLATSVALSLQSTVDYTSFAWSLVGKPAGSAAALTSASGFTSAFTPDVAGTYTVKGTATGADGSTSVRVSVAVVRTAARSLKKLPANATIADVITAHNVATDELDTVVPSASQTQHVATLTALRAVVPEANAGAILAGRAARGDGLGGQYFWDAASTDADDGVYTIAPDAGGDGRWKRLGGVAIVEGEVDAADFGVPRSGDPTVTRTKLTEAIAYAIANSKRLVIPPGTFVVNATGNVLNGNTSNSIQVPSNAHIYGRGGTVKLVGVNNADPELVGTNLPENCAFYVLPGAENVLFDGVDFIGENDPYTFVTNNQSAAIYARGITDGGVFNAVQDLTVRGCTFRNLHGFTVHTVLCDVFTFDGCESIQCGNGLNPNEGTVLIRDSYFEECEGLELACKNINVSECVFVDIVRTGAISLGGRGNPVLYNATLTGIIVDGCDGQGIAIADGLQNVEIASTVLRNCGTHGVLIHRSDQGTATTNVSLTGVTVQGCTQIGFYINGSVTGIRLRGCTAVGAGSYGAYFNNTNGHDLDGYSFAGAAGGLGFENASDILLGDGYASSYFVFNSPLSTRHTASGTTSTLSARNFARKLAIVSGTPGTTHTVTVPLVDGLTRIVRNATTDGSAIVWRSATGTGPTIANGVTKHVYCDGTDWVAL